MKSPAAKPVAKDEKEKFLAEAHSYLLSMGQLVLEDTPVTIFSDSNNVVAHVQTTPNIASTH